MSAEPTPVDAWPDGPPAGAGGALFPLSVTVTGQPAPAADQWHGQLALHQLDAGAVLPVAPSATTRITALDAPLTLRHADGSERTLLRLQVAQLQLDDHVLATEPTRVVVLHLPEGRAAELIARPLHGPMLLPAGARWMAWLLAGRAEIQWGDQRWPLPVNQPMWLPDDTAHRLRIDGGGEVLLVQIDTRDGDASGFAARA